MSSSSAHVCVFIQQTPEAWRNVFYIAAAVYVFGAIFYGIFGSGQRQDWATEAPKPDMDEEEAEEAPKKDTAA